MKLEIRNAGMFLDIKTSGTPPTTRIPVVCSFVVEAIYGGLFAAARIAVDKRNILADLGHPQPATVIFCNNEIAIGLAS